MPSAAGTQTEVLPPVPPTLHLGCGLKRLPNALNVDVVASVRPDVVHDLNQRPWPFPTGAFTEVLAYDVIEHLDDIVGTMEEIHRVCAPGAVVKITVPHFSCANAFTDPTHKRFFTAQSFHYFTGENEFPFYTTVRFRRQVAKIVFRETLTGKVVWQMANRWPVAYEQRWAWIFPAWFLVLRTRGVKACLNVLDQRTSGRISLKSVGISSETVGWIGTARSSTS